MASFKDLGYKELGRKPTFEQDVSFGGVDTARIHEYDVNPFKMKVFSDQMMNFARFLLFQAR